MASSWYPVHVLFLHFFHFSFPLRPKLFVLLLRIAFTAIRHSPLNRITCLVHHLKLHQLTRKWEVMWKSAGKCMVWKIEICGAHSVNGKKRVLDSPSSAGFCTRWSRSEKAHARWGFSFCKRDICRLFKINKAIYMQCKFLSLDQKKMSKISRPCVTIL